MNNELTQVAFDYNVLSPDQARRTQDAEYRIIGRTQKTIIENGRDLLAVKQDIGHGYFLDWIRSIGISDNTAEALINIFKNFGQIPPGGEFENHALYLLSTSKVPESARQEAKERAESGEKITEDIAKQIRDAHKAKEEALVREQATQQELFQQKLKSQDDINALSTHIENLQQEMATLAEPKVQIKEVPVVPLETTTRLQELELQVTNLTRQKVNLTKLNEELSEDLDAKEAEREREARESRLRKAWQDATDTLYKAVNRFQGQLPLPIDTRMFDADDWARLTDVEVLFKRTLEQCANLRQNIITQFVDSPLNYIEG